MNLLLDTHIAIWAVSDRSRLSVRALDLLLDPDNAKWVSVVSVWEIAIKHSLGKRAGASELLPSSQAAAAFESAGFASLAIGIDHACAVETLPFHHGDPFDRLLVAQAGAEDLHLLTADKTLAAYGDRVMLV